MYRLWKSQRNIFFEFFNNLKYVQALLKIKGAYTTQSQNACPTSTGFLHTFYKDI
jgi:hypothetical protein